MTTGYRTDIEIDIAMSIPDVSMEGASFTRDEDVGAIRASEIFPRMRVPMEHREYEKKNMDQSTESA